MGILEMKRNFKKNFIGDTVRNIYNKATEKKDKSEAIIKLNQTKKDINNSKFELEHSNLENDLKLQDLKDNFTLKKCNMMIRKSRNKGKIKMIKKDTSNIKTNIINVIFSIISGILSCVGIFLTYDNNIIFGLLFGILMCAVTTSNSCYIQLKMFDIMRLKRNNHVKTTLIGYIVACTSCLVISLITNKITMDKLLYYCNLNDVYKMILSVTFTLLFDIVPLLNNSIRYNFNMCLYNEDTNKLLDNQEEKKEDETKKEDNTIEFVDTRYLDNIEHDNIYKGEEKNDQNILNTEIGVDEENVENVEHGKPGRKKTNNQEEFDNMILQFNNGDIITPSKVNYTWNGTYKRLRDNCKYIQKDDNGKYIVAK